MALDVRNWKQDISHKFFIHACSALERAVHCHFSRGTGSKSLEPFRFDGPLGTNGQPCCTAAKHAQILRRKNSLAIFSSHDNLTARAKIVPFQGEPKMAWKAPKIVEVPCGMEINMYVSATRK
jgi:coenzyme PQQ precursor peptide PqqA